METVTDPVEEERAVPRTRLRIALRAAAVALVMTGTVALVHGLAQMWCSGITGRALLALGGADPRLLAESLPQFLQLEARDGVVLYIEDLPVWVRVLSMAPALVAGVVAFVASLFVVRLVRAIARGDAFGSQPRRALASAGVVCLVGGLLQGVLDTAAVAGLLSLTRSSTQVDGTALTDLYRVMALDVPHWPVQTILVGAVACILLLAFRAGAELQEEAVGVV